MGSPLTWKNKYLCDSKVNKDDPIRTQEALIIKDMMVFEVIYSIIPTI